MPMKTSPRGIRALCALEECKLKAYRCQAGVWTIGVGHTKGVKPGDTCTKDQAMAWLAEDLAPVEADVNRLVKVSLTQGQFDALVLFRFNVGNGDAARGISGFSTSEALKKLNAGDYVGACASMAEWNKITLRDKDGKPLIVDGRKVRKVSPGLVNRRRAEARVFNG